MTDDFVLRVNARRNRDAGRAPRTGKADESRQRLCRAVRAACKRLGIDDDDRRAMQLDLSGRASMTDMTPAELGKLLDHLNRGWTGPMAHRGHVAKVKALWWSLYWLGEIAEPGDRALDALVKRQTGISSLRFLGHAKAPAVIEALKAWLTRAGVAWPTADETADIAACAPAFTPALHDRHAVLHAIATKEPLRRLGEEGDYRDVLCRALGLRLPAIGWSAHELDMAIRYLGRRLRQAQAKG